LFCNPCFCCWIYYWWKGKLQPGHYPYHFCCTSIATLRE
jgi:hypothetical protein